MRPGEVQRGGLAAPPSRAQELDPIVTGRPLSDDLIGAVRRGITHDENCELLAGVVLPEKEAELAFDQRRLVRRRHHARHCREAVVRQIVHLNWSAAHTREPDDPQSVADV